MDERVYELLETVGRTPLVRLRKLSPAGGAEVCVKIEARNPGGSVKDRPALQMILAAEQSGALVPGSTIVEATSGNTGISLAMIAAVRGYRCVLVMPEDMSVERRHVLRAYGAEVVLRSAHEAMQGAVDRAERLVRTTPGAFMPRQFDNEANPRAHELSTAREILRATDGVITGFVAGVGTGGTVTGVGRVLKRERPNVVVVAVEPATSAVLSGGDAGPHELQGIGAGFVPPVLDRAVVDSVMTVTDADALRTGGRLAREEGVLAGPSSGANVHAAIELARTQAPGGRVVTIVCDLGERYLR